MSVENYPPRINKNTVKPAGSQFHVTAVELKHDVQTQMGLTKNAFFITGKLDDSKDLSYHFAGADGEKIGGSLGRILSKVGITKLEEATPKALSKLVGMILSVSNNGGKLWWN